MHHFTSFARNTSHTARLLINKVPPSLTRLLWQKSHNDFHWKVTEISSVFNVCISTGIAHYLEICILCIFLLQQTDRSITNNPPHSIQDGLNIAFTYIKEEMLFRNHPKCTIDNDYPSFFLIISKA